MDQHFQIEVSKWSRGTVLSLRGELDLSSSAALEDELHRVAAVSLVVVDLRSLEFIDSTGLGVLIRAHQGMQEDGHRLVLVEGAGQVSRLLKLAGVSDQLTIVGDLEELLGAT